MTGKSYDSSVFSSCLVKSIHRISKEHIVKNLHALYITGSHSEYNKILFFQCLRLNVDILSIFFYRYRDFHSAERKHPSVISRFSVVSRETSASSLHALKFTCSLTFTGKYNSWSAAIFRNNAGRFSYCDLIHTLSPFLPRSLALHPQR